MYPMLKEDLKTIIAIFLVIILTQTVFFIVYSYCMSGDPYLALKNFYNTMYKY